MKEELKTRTEEKTQSLDRTAEQKRKKKYNKPKVVYQAPLEAMAATCTTFPGKESGVCTQGFS